MLLATVLANAAIANATDKLLIYPEVDAPPYRRSFAAFQEAMRKEGLYERYQLRVEFLPVEATDDNKLRAQLAAAIARRPDAIIGTSLTVALALKELTSDIPVVFSAQSDPVAHGLIASYAHPGNNFTGVTKYSPANGKRLEILKTAYPHIRKVGVLADIYWLANHFHGVDRKDAERLGLTLTIFEFIDPTSLAKTMKDPRVRHMDAWFVPQTFSADTYREAVLEKIQRLHKPVMYGRYEFVEGGGLMSYQPLLDDFRLAWARRLTMIWAGTAPGDIPVERPIQFELCVNASTARDWGMPIAKTILKRADKIY